MKILTIKKDGTKEFINNIENIVVMTDEQEPCGLWGKIQNGMYFMRSNDPNFNRAVKHLAGDVLNGNHSGPITTESNTA